MGRTGDNSLDPFGRGGALAIAAGRVAFGVAIAAAPRRALRGLGLDDSSPSAVVLARLAGGRDVALGLHGLAARDDAKALRDAVAITAAVDAADGLTFLGAWMNGDIGGRTVAVNLPLIAAAVAAGGVVAARLRG